MLENIWTEYLKEQLAGRFRGYTPPDHLYRPLPDRWVAMSLLEKAIRRQDVSLKHNVQVFTCKQN